MNTRIALVEQLEHEAIEIEVFKTLTNSLNKSRGETQCSRIYSLYRPNFLDSYVS